jgi:hypothetical protein
MFAHIVWARYVEGNGISVLKSHICEPGHSLKLTDLSARTLHQTATHQNRPWQLPEHLRPSAPQPGQLSGVT